MALFGPRTAGMLAAAAAAMATFATAAETFTLRISTENAPSHFQTRIVDDFAKALSARAQGRIDVRHVPGGTLFSDREAVRALELGQLEMAVPGIWQIDRAVPDAGLFLLPMFYGRAEADLHAAADGAPGREVAAAIERELEVVVPGRWIDLGFTHIFARGKPISAYADFAGRRIRVAGGEANIARQEALGAAAVVIPWADFPEALKLGTVDGTLTSFETVASAKLWELGLTSAFADRQYFAQYVPLVSRRFWERLPEDLQAAVAIAWEECVDPGRALAATAQGKARDAFIAAGGDVFEPTAEARARAREILLSRQDALVAVLGIDAALVARTQRFLDAPP